MARTGSLSGRLSWRSFMRRRSFLTHAVAAAATASVPLSSFPSRTQPNPPSQDTDYGPLVPAIDETTGLTLLSLPEGFRYLSFGWTGDEMANGSPTPGVHDGMAAMHWRGHRIRLVRNHEVGVGTPF